ncbi:MAG: hypothetical protein ACP5OA_00475 [Candidatus Woesearchaeota archaeon]
MKDFKEFIKNGVVKKQSPNRQRALSLIAETAEKKRYLDIIIQLVPKEKWNPNVIVDQCYDIFMELLRAKMFLDGYNAGNSHEAEVSYMTVLGFTEPETKYMDEIRYYRNGTKYYGTMLNTKYAENVIKFLNKTYPKLIKLLN